MKNIFKDGIQNIKDIQLTESEKSLMFSKISAHMTHTAPAPTSLNWFVFFHKTSVVFAAFIFIFSGAAVVVASEASLPGDLLYPIKVSVKEPIVSAMSLGQSAKIRAEASKASERLKEAEKLSETGRLNADTRKEIEDRFEKHVEKMDSFVENDSKKEYKKIEKKVKAQSDFEDDVLRHTEELDKIKEDLSDDEKIEVENLKNKVLQTVQSKKENKKNEKRGSDSNRSQGEKGKDTENAEDKSGAERD
jgi:hypothetical protein